MPEMLSNIYKLLVELVLPSLGRIQSSQAEQRAETERLNRSVTEFRAEMQVRFAELRAELAVTRQMIEDAMVTINEGEVTQVAEALMKTKKTLVH